MTKPSPQSLANLKPCKPGETHNPGGRPVGARNKLTGDFLHKLAADFEKNGKAAIAASREKDPTGYIRAIAGLLPKEFKIERPLEGLSDDEIHNLLAELRRLIAFGPGIGGGTTITIEPEQARILPPVHQAG